MEINDQTLTELVRLTQENNRMLHKMRRNALWGGILKFVLYALVLVVAPLWLYATYLGPMMEQVLDTYQQIQGTGAKAQAQFSDIQNFFQQLKNTVSPQQ
ncbi:hypothetical protein A3A40_00470 [Candidatus Kaiserbacteria bacterium RIFCSPLOWO2_01_FULL_54_20]|uniref:Uncharacterized protein n=1 Tax=Candidatus Kaiserbacteria bacterium RIFCSPLOWO2_01_FULL_54_20 TaxID=1798513 RepID=A0A1F6EK82_9BACT|nr:MAG: hypothetical protein A3A40_00470 [Candidatus Kaiserbacteria bacterium RIFCSPLOWO2_01_FULL_54_20]